MVVSFQQVLSAVEKNIPACEKGTKAGCPDARSCLSDCLNISQKINTEPCIEKDELAEIIQGGIQNQVEKCLCCAKIMVALQELETSAPLFGKDLFEKKLEPVT